MAFADLNFTAALWQGRGLRWLAAQTELPPELSLMAAPAAATAQQRRESPAPRPARQENRARPQEQIRPPAGTSAQAPRAAGTPGTQGAAGPGTRWRPLAPAALPEPWRSRFDSTKAGRVAWTYWALGQDLAAGPGADGAGEAQARAARRAFLARLLRDLGHPAGTHTFWPACLPAEASGAAGEEAAFAAHADAFWSGAAHLGCRAVIVMGSPAVRALGLPARARPLAQLRWLGQLVLVLWDVDTLAGDEARYAPTLAFLRQALAPVARPR